MASSKTARASVRAGQSGQSALSVLGEFKYLIPLNKGKSAYVRDRVTGKTVRASTDSEKFVEVIRSLSNAGFADKVRLELDAFAEQYPADGWEETTKRLVEAGALGSAE